MTLTRAPANRPGLAGLMEVYESKQKPDLSWKTVDPSIWAHPALSGVAFRVPWAAIAPAENTRTWDVLDALFRDATAHDRYVALLITSGFDTPAWALAGVETAQFCRKYGPGAGTPGTLPIPWDAVYLGRWIAFLGEVAARYATHPALRLLGTSGPTSVSMEMSLPNQATADCPDIATWQAHGYTPDKYVSAWEQVFEAYRDLFPKQWISLALSPGLELPTQADRVTTRQRVIDAHAAILGERAALQTSGLNASKVNDPDSDAGYNIVTAASGTYATGFQASTSATNKPTKMGDPDNPVHALELTIEKGLAAGSAFLQIYQPDWLNPSMRRALWDGMVALVPPRGEASSPPVAAAQTTWIKQSSSQTGNASPVSVTLKDPPTPGNRLVAICAANVTPTSVSGWTDVAHAVTGGGGQETRLFTTIAGVGESDTITMTAPGATNLDLIVLEIAGSDVGAADVTAVANDTGSARTSASTGTTPTTTVPDALAIGVVSTIGTNGDIVDATNEFAIEDVSTNRVIVLTKVLSAVGPQESTATWVTSRRAGGLMVVFPAASNAVVAGANTYGQAGYGTGVYGP